MAVYVGGAYSGRKPTNIRSSSIKTISRADGIVSSAAIGYRSAPQKSMILTLEALDDRFHNNNNNNIIIIII